MLPRNLTSMCNNQNPFLPTLAHGDSPSFFSRMRGCKLKKSPSDGIETKMHQYTSEKNESSSSNRSSMVSRSSLTRDEPLLSVKKGFQKSGKMDSTPNLTTIKSGRRYKKLSQDDFDAVYFYAKATKKLGRTSKKDKSLKRSKSDEYFLNQTDGIGDKLISLEEIANGGDDGCSSSSSVERL